MKFIKYKIGQKVLVRCEISYSDSIHLLEGKLKKLDLYNDTAKRYVNYLVQIGDNTIWVDFYDIFKDEKDFLKARLSSIKFYIKENKDKIKKYRKFLKEKTKNRHWLKG